MISIIEFALIFWIKKQCTSIEIILFKINTSIRNIIKGKIDNIILTANKINYQDISINNAELKTTEITIRNKLNMENIEIVNKFEVNGVLKLTNKDIYNTITSTKWSGIISSLLKLDEDIHIVKSLNIFNDTIVIEYIDLEKEGKYLIPLNLSIINSKLFFINYELSINDYFPKDNSIFLDSFDTKKDLMIIRFHAKVS